MIRKAETLSLQPVPEAPAEELVRTMRHWLAQWPRRSLDRLLRQWLREAEGKCLRLDPAAEGTRLAREQGLVDGFRSIINTGRIGRQEVYHLHLHILGGPEPLGAMIRK